VRWLALLALGAGAPAWIVLRDWSPPGAPAAERARVLTAARLLCTGGCEVRALRRARSGRWELRLRGRRHSACLLVDPDRVAVEPGRGLVGAAPVACPPR
jgi:hypothetical protein